MLLPSRCYRQLRALVPIMLLGMQPYCQAQTDTIRLSISGRASLNAEYYTLSTEPTSFFYARRPAQLYRLFLNPEFRYGSLSVPCTFMLTAQQTNYTTGVSNDQSFSQFVQNPLNVIAVEPQWKWLRGHLGSYTPRWSELSVGDVQLFGLGVDVTPGTVRASAFRGITQRALEPLEISNAFNGTGAYERVITGLKFGIGSEKEGYVDLNVVHALDDTTSVTRPPADSIVRPQELLLVSLAAHLVVDSAAILNIEAAASLNTRNIRSELLESSSIPELPGFTPRTSSRADIAASAALLLGQRTTGITLQAKYIGGGFASPGYPLLVPDRFEATASPRFATSNGALQAGATIGYRLNNVSNQQSSSLNQLLFSVNTQWMASEEWSLAATFSNFGVRSSSINDSARIQSVARYGSLTPSYRLKTQNAIHTLSCNLSIDKYTDDNLVSGLFTSNNTIGLCVNDGMMMTSMPLSVQASLSYIHNVTNFTTLTTMGFSASGSYGLLNNTLYPGLRLAYNTFSYKQGEANAQYLFGVQCGYRLNTRTSVNLNVALNHFSFGTTRTSSYTESTLQLSLSTQF